ncbi:MAG: TonB-dependent receptor plug domain-containing protein [Proteobacteria bacterium]|nr:TonB-dependent receptor plug domain-containing protein [Pseudomonadota bacterium]
MALSRGRRARNQGSRGNASAITAGRELFRPSLGTGTEVSLVAVERIEIVGSRVRTIIDTSSTESNSVFTQSQIQALPVTRSVDAVALLAPGTVRGDSFGSNLTLPSFGGASIAENGYFINGLDVTNIRTFLSYADLPFDSIQQQQVKTGGYGAEFGRSLGGVVNLVTKRGTNNWTGGIATYWEPDALRSSGQNVDDLEPSRTGRYTLFNAADQRDKFSMNLYGGGPLIENKLFFFGLVEIPRVVNDDFRSADSQRFKNHSPKGMIKLDFAPTDSHLFEFTAIQNKDKYTITDYTSNSPYSTSHDTFGGVSNYEAGGQVYIGKYTGYITEDLTVSALYGRITDLSTLETGYRKRGADCPVVLDVDLSPLGCWGTVFPGAGGTDPDAPPDKDQKKSWRIDVEYSLGDHNIKAGYDAQRFQSWAAGGSSYSAGHYYRYYVSPTGSVNGIADAVAPGGGYVRDRISLQTSGSYVVLNNAFYLEDSWKATKDLLLYGGLRWESFDNQNGDGVSFVKQDNLLAPRLGFSLDVDGDSSTKVFGTAGRYYIPVASNTNIRMTRGELFTQNYYSYTGKDPVTGAPTGMGPAIGTPQVVGDGTLPNPGTVADINLKPMNQDEFILGIQKALTPTWTGGIKGIYRKINSGMDDFCDEHRITQYANENGYPDATWTGCILMNPGRDLTMNIDSDGAGTLKKITIPASYLGLTPYTRTYKAVEFSLGHPFDGVWGLSASYTWSRSRGSAEGYVQSTLQQEDAGVTQDFDFATLADGAVGYLPNDRTHVFKMFGNYMVTDEWRIGGNMIVSSGRPLSCIGFVPESVAEASGSTDVLNYTSASSYYCLNGSGELTTDGLITQTPASLVPRGTVGRTSWTGQVDLSIAYIPKWADKKLTLQVDIFNLFNSQKPIRLDEVRDFSRGTSNGSENFQQSANYLRPLEFQSPRSVRLTARYDF